MWVQFSGKQYCQLSQILKLFLFQIVYVSIIGDLEEAENSDDAKEAQESFSYDDPQEEVEKKYDAALSSSKSKRPETVGRLGMMV